MNEQILINVTPQETRVAVTEQGAVQELHIERDSSRGLVGNIYLGRVCRVLPGMQSAFVEIGLPRAAFRHVADIWAARNGAGGERPIEKILAEGQTLLVQVVKDPIGSKGARLSTQVSIAGRLLVYLPQDPHIGISQRIGDEAEREHLREKVLSLIPPGETGGFIVRTVAESAHDAELSADIEYLITLWKQIQTAAHSASRCSGGIFCETPRWSSCGRNTSSRPAMLICVDRRAPLVPMGSLMTCTVSVCPSKTRRSMGGGGAAPGPCSARGEPATWTSATWRNAARSRPMSMNADCMPGSTRATRPA